MNKPNNYESISVNRDPVKLGGHIAVIKKVEETYSKGGKPQVVIYIDFDIQDEQYGYFKNVYDSDTRDEKKWPNDAKFYITNSNQETFDRNIKQFVTSFEDSNNATAVWGAQWAAQFIGKKIGVVYGEEESEWHDEIRTNRKIRYFCDAHKALEQDVPRKKRYKGSDTQAAEDVPADSWMDIPDGDDGTPFR